jgi:membrane protein YqaA with SNARE-associated domain
MTDASPATRLPASSERPAREAGLAASRLLLSTATVLVGLTAAAALVGYFLREPFVALSEAFVETLGGPGVALGCFLPDAFTVPVPSDLFTTFGVAGGMSFSAVVLWATLGSLAGGTTGFFVGTRLKRMRSVARFLSARPDQVERLVRRYGPWALAVAALTPIPYSLACWAAGATNMELRTFLLVSQLRFVRYAAFLYLIQLGLVSATGLR